MWASWDSEFYDLEQRLPELTQCLLFINWLLCLLPQDASARSFFDPTSQHRDWCPWVNITLGKETRENGGTEVDASTPAEPGWKAVLNILLAHKQSNQPAETDSMVR